MLAVVVERQGEYALCSSVHTGYPTRPIRRKCGFCHQGVIAAKIGATCALCEARVIHLWTKYPRRYLDLGPLGLPRIPDSLGQFLREESSLLLKRTPFPGIDPQGGVVLWSPEPTLTETASASANASNDVRGTPPDRRWIEECRVSLRGKQVENTEDM